MDKMIEKIKESFFSKVGEKLADYGWGTVGDITNFKSTLENLKRNLNSLSAKADDVKKEIRIVEQSGKKKRRREVENWLEQVTIIESECRTLANEVSMEGFIKQFLGGDGAKEMNARVCELVEQSRHFGELALDDDSTRGEAFLTSRLVGEAFRGNLERIWTFLVTDKVPSIGIYGMGGVGKSTLAKHINNQLLERTDHECVLWVTVSQECSIKMLQDKIASVLDLKLSDEYDEDKRAARLNRALSLKKNFVLMLDDVWRSIDLEKVGVPHFVDGCKLIITTRSLEVCRQIGCQEMVAVKPLNTDEGWNLFSEKLGQETTLAPQVQEIAMSVAKVCNGLPLGIITIAGSMRGETDIRVWRNTLTELQKSVMENDEMEDQVFKVLKYSFDRLDPNHQRQGKALQLCFLYCSLYPEDCSTERDELVRKFISEELVDKRNSTGAQLDEGHSILNRLVNASLLESVSFCGEDCVKMHDLVRAMALKITEDKTMVIAGQMLLEKIPIEEEWTMNLEKISLMDNGIREIPHGMSPNCPKLSTLLLQNNPLELIPESFFSKMCGLCTLDLSGTLIKELPNSLSELESLKALLLRGCEKLEYVPYLGKLKALKELDLSDTAIEKFPEGMEKLVNLKYLLMNGAAYLQMLPTGLLLNLRCLRLLCLPYEMQAQLEGIERLKQLERFEGRVKDMSDFNRFIESRPGKQHIVSYCILVGEPEFEDDVLDGLASRFLTYERINRVIVFEYDFKNREEKDVIMLAEDIQHLEFRWCKGLSNCLLDDLSNPRSLEKLEISDCKGIECILRYEQLIMAPQELESGFQALEEITLWWLHDFMGVIHKREMGAAVVASPAPPPPQVVFSSLRRLSILGCDKMKKLGLPISAFQKLESIEIKWCEEIEEIIEVADDEDIIRSGEGEEAALAISLPKLKELMLEFLPRLRSICSSMHKREIGDVVVASPAPPPLQLVFSSLRRLSIRWCFKMKKLGLPISAFQKLESIEIAGCEELEEIIEVADDDDIIRSGEGEEAALAISLPKLKELVLEYLPRLTSICKATVICDSIERINLQRCRALKKLPLYFASSTTVPPALQEIKAEKEWWDSLEWEHPSHPQLLQPFFQFIYF